MIQELLWLYPEFIDGFLYGRDGKKRKRDANPYSDISRKASWDSGYILGLSEPKVGEWLGERLEEKP